MIVEPAADRRDHARAGDEQLACVLISDQVELAVAVARLDVGQPVMLLRGRPQRLREHRERGDPQRELPTARGERDPVDPDQIPEVEPQQQLHPGRAELVDSGLQLDPA